MQKKKIFIEIAIPDRIGKRLMQKIEPWKSLPVKWMKQSNLHLTVAFVGYVDEEVIPEICEKVNYAVANLEPFDLEFDRIELGPDNEHPKQIWLTGEASESLKELNRAVETALDMRPVEHHVYRPHVTLGRIRKEKWEALEKKPVIEESFSTVISVEYVSVMESRGGGAEYFSLEECPLS